MVSLTKVALATGQTYQTADLMPHQHTGSTVYNKVDVINLLPNGWVSVDQCGWKQFFPPHQILNGEQVPDATR